MNKEKTLIVLAVGREELARIREQDTKQQAARSLEGLTLDEKREALREAVIIDTADIKAVSVDNYLGYGNGPKGYSPDSEGRLYYNSYTNLWDWALRIEGSAYGYDRKHDFLTFADCYNSFDEAAKARGLELIYPEDYLSIDNASNIAIVDPEGNASPSDDAPAYNLEKQEAQDEMGFNLKCAIEHLMKKPEDGQDALDVITGAYDAWTENSPPFITSVRCEHMIENEGGKVEPDVLKVSFLIASGGPNARLAFNFNKDEKLESVAFDADHSEDTFSIEGAEQIAVYLVDSDDWEKEDIIKALFEFGEWLSTQFRFYD